MKNWLVFDISLQGILASQIEQHILLFIDRAGFYGGKFREDSWVWCLGSMWAVEGVTGMRAGLQLPEGTAGGETDDILGLKFTNSGVSLIRRVLFFH